MAEISGAKERKILIATGVFPPDIGGPATYSKLLFEELPKHGLDVEVISFGFVRHLPKLIRHFIYFLKILKKGGSSDVIFAQDPVSVGLPAVLAAKILRKKFVLKIVGDYAWEQYCQRNIVSLEFPIPNSQLPTLEDFQKERYDFITEMRRKIELWVAEKADKIIVPSKYLKKIVGMWGVDGSKINVIYNAFGEARVNGAKDIGVIGENFIISIGRLVPWKGFDVLLDVIRELPAEMKLKIIGSGPDKANLEFRIKNLRLENRVSLIGQLPHQELIHCLAAAKIFVLNTGYEGLSHAILEAMACGVPVVTTNVGGNPELIKDKYNGILVEYDNKEQLKTAILKLSENPELGKLYVENSRKELRKFNLETMIREVIKTLVHENS